MTEIQGVGRPAAPRAANRVATPSGFFVPPEPAGTGQASAAAVSHATPLGSMLTLQELGGETLADRDARRHGHDMLRRWQSCNGRCCRAATTWRLCSIWRSWRKRCRRRPIGVSRP